MKRPKRLTTAFVQRVREPGRYGDGRGGNGLSLLVKANKGGGVSRTWCQRLYVGKGVERDFGLGGFPDVGLAEARGLALDNKAALRRGEDIGRRRSPVGEGVPRGTGLPTVAEASAAALAIHAPSWKPGSKTAAQWERMMADYVLPAIGAKPVDRVTPADVLAILAPLTTSKPETARKLRQRLSMVFRWAKMAGHRPDDPTDGIEAVMPKRNGKAAHHRALPHGEVSGALATVRASAAWDATKLAIEFLTLTATRSGEVRAATWAEVDIEGATWTVPAAKTKTGAEHRVPLSGRAVAILEAVRTLSGGEGLVFPSVTGRALSDNTLSKLIRELGIACVPHGMRASFREWCGANGVDREVAEAALAHSRPGVEAAYHRADLLERRREVMNAWADYLAR